jgi:multimeric flavodoxin WrbA
VHAAVLNCTLKASPEPSSTEALARVVMTALEERGVTTDLVRLADFDIAPGVVSEPVREGDEWPAIRARILAADILVIATPTWLGQPSSISKRALERMDAFLSESKDDGRPIAYDKVAGFVVTGNEDGAHHVIAELAQAVIDLGYTVPGHSWTYWNKGPGPGDEVYLTTDEREWTDRTGRTAALNLLAVAEALAARPLPPPSD